MGAPLPRSMAWRTPSRSTTTAVTVYPFCAQITTDSPTSSLASGAESFCMLTNPCADDPAATPTITAAITAPAAAIRDMPFPPLILLVGRLARAPTPRIIREARILRRPSLPLSCRRQRRANERAVDAPRCYPQPHPREET